MREDVRGGSTVIGGLPLPPRVISCTRTDVNYLARRFVSEQLVDRLIVQVERLRSRRDHSPTHGTGARRLEILGRGRLEILPQPHGAFGMRYEGKRAIFRRRRGFELEVFVLDRNRAMKVSFGERNTGKCRVYVLPDNNLVRLRRRSDRHI